MKNRETLQHLVERFGNKHKLQFFAGDDIGNANNKNPPPLVLLIGWYGSKFRFVSKYAAIYTRKGYDVLGYIPDSWELFSQQYSKDGVKKILDLIETDQKENESSFIIHAFSNNGGLFVARMMTLLDENKNDYVNLRRGYRGLISDSFPGVNTDDKDAISVLSGYNYDKNLKKVVPDKNSIGIVGLGVRFLIYCAFYYYYHISNLSEKFYEEYLGELSLIPKVFGEDTPMLVMYANEDFIVPSKSVYAFWSQYKDRKSVKICCFEGDIDHIKIFVVEPEKYCAEIDQFTHQHIPINH